MKKKEENTEEEFYTEIEPIKGLWEEIIKESETKTENEEAYLYICGDIYTGKKSLFKAMNNISKNEKCREINLNDDVEQYGLISFDNIQQNKISDEGDNIKYNIRTCIINSYKDKNVFVEFNKLENLFNCVFLIVVDLSRPWNILESLKNWIYYIQENITLLQKKSAKKKKFDEQIEQCKFINLIKNYRF